nr:DALR anticodon-binding domain-containing protein 3 isoform X2 [Drosophila kikkawai]
MDHSSPLHQAGDYGRRSKTEQSPTLSLTLQNAGVRAGQTPQELRHYRLQVIYNIIRRLAEYSPWRLVEPEDVKKDTIRVHVELQKCTQPELKDHVCLVSGPVVEPVQKTATKMTLDGYLELRTTHMRQVAIHRNGIRQSGISNMDTLMKRLGSAAVIVDLASVRHQSAVTLVRNGLGSSKGASYILYNSARLETLLRTFNDQVKAKVYDPLPPLEEIDLSILEDDLDWEIIYGYLLPFPDVLESLLEQLPQGSCGIHQFVRYIENLAGVTSRYYRHKKVLVQRRSQLSPILYARIYLIMTVRQVLNVVLAVLGIEPVDYI